MKKVLQKKREKLNRVIEILTFINPRYIVLKLSKALNFLLCYQKSSDIIGLSLNRFNERW